MTLPEGVSPEVFTEAVEKSIKVLADSFVFGYLTVEDVRQECWVIALELMESNKYDPSRGALDGFIYRHLTRRLINLRRKLLMRNDPPCRACHNGEPCSDGERCQKYVDWKKRNTSKASILCAKDISSIDESRIRCDARELEEQESSKELRSKIDAGLPAELRSDYLRLLDGCNVPKARRLVVEEAIRGILGE